MEYFDQPIFWSSSAESIESHQHQLPKFILFWVIKKWENLCLLTNLPVFSKSQVDVEILDTKLLQRMGGQSKQTCFSATKFLFYNFCFKFVKLSCHCIIIIDILFKFGVNFFFLENLDMLFQNLIRIFQHVHYQKRTFIHTNLFFQDPIMGKGAVYELQTSHLLKMSH